MLSVLWKHRGGKNYSSLHKWVAESKVSDKVDHVVNLQIAKNDISSSTLEHTHTKVTSAQSECFSLS
jgi:hypothetical protein